MADSKLFQDYQRVFAAATGLRPELRNPDSSGLEDGAVDRVNPICARLGLGGKSCVACRLFNQSLARAAQRFPQTRECPAGLCKTVVPVRNGNRVIALLQIGPVRLRSTTGDDVERVMQLTSGATDGISAEQVQEALSHAHTMSVTHYASFVQLLEIFSRQLAEWFAQHAPAARPREPLAILRAREWIETHYHEPLSLADMAAVTQMSTWHFCRSFHFSTGSPFRAFLARTRVTQAMRLLADPQNAIGEVALAVGFRSISQFNRTFRQLTGQSAGAFRSASTKQPSETAAEPVIDAQFSVPASA